MTHEIGRKFNLEHQKYVKTVDMAALLLLQ
jgi:hypothetical protein